MRFRTTLCAASLVLGAAAHANNCNGVGPDSVITPTCVNDYGTHSHLGKPGGPVAPAIPGSGRAPGQVHTVLPWYGNSPTSIAKQMPVVLLWEAQNNPGTAGQMQAMGPYLFANFTSDYIRNGGNVAAFLAGVAKFATPAQLVYIRSGFGAATDTAVASYSPAAVQKAYVAAAKSPSISTSHAMLVDRGLVTSLGGFLPATFSMTQNELFWMYFTEGTGTTVLQAVAKMTFFEANVLYTTGVYSYKAGGYIVTFLDKINPNINIEIGNLLGVTVDWTVSLVENTPTGTAYVDLPVDSEGNFIFPGDYDFTIDFNDFYWSDFCIDGC